MLDFCGGSFVECIQWVNNLSLEETVFLVFLVFLALFIVLRIVNKIIGNWEGYDFK